MQATSPTTASDTGLPPPAPRRRRLSAALAALIVTTAVGGGLAAAVIFTGGQPMSSSVPERTVSPTARTGAVTGYIDACAVLVTPRQPHAAGTVKALPGRLTWKPNGPGTYRLVLPTTTAATQHVAAGAAFSFHLAPGHYVLVTGDNSRTVMSFASVTVAAGRVVHKDLPNLCK